MPQDLISNKTRYEFREWLVAATTLSYIDEVFGGNGVILGTVPAGQLPGGQRRALVEEYYASVDWTNPVDVKRVLRAYEDILLDVCDRDRDMFERFIRVLQRDGFEYQNSRLVSTALDADIVASVSSGSLDVEHLDAYVERINGSIEDDPALAIGSTKELVEAVLKTILDARNIAYVRHDDIPKLLKAVQGALQLLPSDIDDAKKGAATAKRTLSNLGSVVIGIAELRNLYGTGHGKGSGGGGVKPRHARLVVGAGVTLSRFLLETHEVREGREV